MLLHWAILLGTGAAVATKFTLHERIEAIPAGWQQLGEAEYEEPCELHIALPENDSRSFQNRVVEISTPGHEDYSEYMTEAQIAQWLGASDESTSSVLTWLASHGIASYDHYTHDMVTFTTTAGKANEMFGTNFAWYENEHGSQVLRTLHYSIPEHLKPHVDFVYPTIKFPTTKAQMSVIKSGTSSRKAARDTPLTPPQGTFMDEGVQGDSNETCMSHPTPECVKKLPCSEAILPQCLLKLYNVQYRPNTTTKLAFASFIDFRALKSDLRMFVNKVAEYAKGSTYDIVGLDGAVDNQDTVITGEANLDGQYQIGVGYPNPVTEYLTDGDGPLIPGPNALPGHNRNEPYIRFLKALLSMPQDQLPPTLSISYADDEQSWPRPIAMRVCSLFSQLGARGVSVLVASGDVGPGANCTSNNGTIAFNPRFPASCPFVTSVGATIDIPEVPAEFSAGGFSNYFSRPKYQEKYVDRYFQLLGNNNSGLYNRTGRGMPDISALGDPYFIYDDGVFQSNGGTSASAPTWAAIISLINSALVSTGQKPLGFLNPWLYSDRVAATFKDIKTGFSAGCRQNFPTPAMWNASEGWDPTTGLGTPNFGKLLSIAVPGVSNTGGPVPP